MFRITFFLIFILQGCASGTPIQRTDYVEPVTGPTSTITFEKASPYFYRKGEPDDSPIRIIRYVPGAYDKFAVVKYDDSSVCRDYAFISPKLVNNEEKIKIKSGKLITFGITIGEETEDRRVLCNNKFSFTPEAGKSYTTTVNLEVSDIRYGRCVIEVFDESEPNTAIEIIHRKNFTPLTGSSPNCRSSEIEKVKTTTKSSSSFKCNIFIGGYRC